MNKICAENKIPMLYCLIKVFLEDHIASLHISSAEVAVTKTTKDPTERVLKSVRIGIGVPPDVFYTSAMYNAIHMVRDRFNFF